MRAPDESRWHRGARGLFAAAAVALIVALAFVAKERRLLLSGAAARGDVVSVKRANGKNAPVVRFAAGGAMHVFTAPASADPVDVADGVDVLYDPANPDHATTEAQMALWMPALLALSVAVLFAGVGLTLLLALRLD